MQIERKRVYPLDKFDAVQAEHREGRKQFMLSRHEDIVSTMRSVRISFLLHRCCLFIFVFGSYVWSTTDV